MFSKSVAYVFYVVFALFKVQTTSKLGCKSTKKSHQFSSKQKGLYRATVILHVFLFDLRRKILYMSHASQSTMPMTNNEMDRFITRQEFNKILFYILFRTNTPTKIHSFCHLVKYTYGLLGRIVPVTRNVMKKKHSVHSSIRCLILTIIFE